MKRASINSVSIVLFVVALLQQGAEAADRSSPGAMQTPYSIFVERGTIEEAGFAKEVLKINSTAVVTRVFDGSSSMFWQNTKAGFQVSYIDADNDGSVETIFVAEGTELVTIILLAKDGVLQLASTERIESERRRLRRFFDGEE